MAEGGCLENSCSVNRGTEGSNPSLSSMTSTSVSEVFSVLRFFSERCPSGLRGSPGKRVYSNVPRVRIPPSPPYFLYL